MLFGIGVDDGQVNGQIAAYHCAVCDEALDPTDRQQAFIEAMELLLLRYARAGRAQPSLEANGLG
jgi:hypothetical protein